MTRPAEPLAARASRLPRLIATDLDGTLLGVDFAVSERSTVALRRASAAGSVVVLVTGRSVRRLSSVYTALGARYLTVCANGAVLYDPDEDLVRECRPIEPNVVREVCLRLRERVPGVVFAAHVECGRRVMYEPRWPVRTDAEEAAFLAGTEAQGDLRVVKLQARTPAGDSDRFYELVTETVGDQVEATRQGYRGLVEMSRRGVTKATALAAVAGNLGISPADVLAFGDMPNDVSMLRWASRSVAVANAHPEARAAAREITSSNVEDGVAIYLERLLDRL
jgi:Cof subfamily protein (haloacid dehalogenase superfamily)